MPARKAPRPTTCGGSRIPGIAHFKAGFGGREVRYVGGWDLVLDPVGRRVYETGPGGAGPLGPVAGGAGPGGRASGIAPATPPRQDERSWPGPAATIPALRVVREATASELAAWDARVVDVPGGDVQQSLAWGLQRERTGARPHHLVLDDGSRRARPGPAPAPPRRRPRLRAARPGGRRRRTGAWWRAGSRRSPPGPRDAGFDVVVADPEIPAGVGLPGAPGRPGVPPGRGGRPVAPPGRRRDRRRAHDDADLLAGIAPKTRQQFLAAERRGAAHPPLRPRAPADDPGPGLDAPPPARPRRRRRGGVRPVPRPPGGDGRAARLQPGQPARGPRLVAGRARGGPPRAPRGAGHRGRARRGPRSSTATASRLTYGHSGDVAEPPVRPSRARWASILWRALQLAAREGRDGAGPRRGRRPRGAPGAAPRRADVRAPRVQAVVRRAVDRARRGPRAGPAPAPARARQRPSQRAARAARAVPGADPAGRARLRDGRPMSEPGTERDDAALRALLAAAEPRDARPLGGLVDRLAAARAAARRRPAGPPASAPIHGIAYDSRRVVPGGVFVAVPGAHVDGHAFVGPRGGAPARSPSSSSTPSTTRGPPPSSSSTGASSRSRSWPPGGTATRAAGSA